MLMWEWLKDGAIIIGFLAFAVVGSSVITKREERQDRDEAAEQARAQRITRRTGRVVISLARTGTAIIMFLGGLGFFFSLVSAKSLSTIGEMVVIFAVSVPAYFWLDRVARALG